MWRRVSECKFSWERSVGPLWAGSHPVFALKKERGNRVSPQFTFFRPMGPFASHTHRVGTAARPPSSLHFSLTIWTTTWPGSSGADSLFGPCSCRPFEDVPGEVLFFFSFFFLWLPSSRTGQKKEKWLPSVTFCQAVTQGGVGEGANVPPALPPPRFVKSTRPSFGFTLLPVSICVWPSLAVSGSGRGHARFAASREMSC